MIFLCMDSYDGAIVFFSFFIIKRGGPQSQGKVEREKWSQSCSKLSQGSHRVIQVGFIHNKCNIRASIFTLTFISKLLPTRVLESYALVERQPQGLPLSIIMMIYLMGISFISKTIKLTPNTSEKSTFNLVVSHRSIEEETKRSNKYFECIKRKENQNSK